LRAVAENLDLLVRDRQTDEPADETLPVVFDELTRSVDVGQTQCGGTDTERIIVDEVVVLAGRLIDAVDVDRLDQMRLGDREEGRFAVNLSGAGEDDLYRRVVLAALVVWPGCCR
jgi:hypothetical protein